MLETIKATMKKIIWVLVCAVLVYACGVDTEDVRLRNRAEEEIVQYLGKTGLSLQKSTSGLYYSITPANKSTRTPKQFDEVAMHQSTYRISDGRKIDSSDVKLNEPEYFTYGIGTKIQGVEEVLALMKEGDKATLVIPPQLAYGATLLPTLPPNSVIRMDIQFISAKTEEERIAGYVAQNKWVEAIKNDTLRLIQLKSTTDTNKVINGKTASVKYTGKFLRNHRKIVGEQITYFTQFDAGTISVKLGAGSVVPGFEAGIKKLKVGEKGVVIFPSQYGYGTQNKGTIPAFSPLLFEIELQSIK